MMTFTINSILEHSTKYCLGQEQYIISSVAPNKALEQTGGLLADASVLVGHSRCESVRKSPWYDRCFVFLFEIESVIESMRRTA